MGTTMSAPMCARHCSVDQVAPLNRQIVAPMKESPISFRDGKHRNHLLSRFAPLGCLEINASVGAKKWSQFQGELDFPTLAIFFSKGDSQIHLGVKRYADSRRT